MSRSGPRRAWDAVRPVIFWCHLAVGTVVGIVVLIMSVTGAALAYQRQTLERMAVRHTVAPAASARLPLDTLRARAADAAGGRRIVGLTVRADAALPLSATLDDRSSLFLDPYTGRILGTDAGVRGFFSAVERIHRSIVSSGTTRSEAGTAVTGAANLGFLFLILTGFLLWWPRRWTPRGFRQVLAFSPGARGRARDWNWHHVLGFWSAPVLLLIVASATFISYEWPQR
ncbi:MAG TPA: PepSY-associated TM helix domain-containing protein, partial [Gemmatimonadales bacterium]|nr:PepSY-associated TM helix domain-containing protein [Gemmatimonadales bacterium]